jgi:hypothetical protein
MDGTESKTSNKSFKLPKKSFLIIDEDDYPSFSSSVLADSNRKLSRTEFSHDEDYDSDRETIRSHKKEALKCLEEQILKFKDNTV